MGRQGPKVRPGLFSYLLPHVLTACRLEQWVSLKVMLAERTNKSRELHNLQAITEGSLGSPGSKYIVQLLDDFIHEGPNGCHQCLVFELLGPTVGVIVKDYHTGRERLDTETILKLSTQLLQAVAFMHEAGYAHGGMSEAWLSPGRGYFLARKLIQRDLNVQNLAFTSGHLSHLSKDELIQMLGPPESEDLIRLDGASLGDSIPSQLVKSAEWAGWPDEDDEDDEDIRIIDLGEAFPLDTSPERVAQPGGMQAPETIFAGRVDHRLDLWRAGLIVRIPRPSSRAAADIGCISIFSSSECYHSNGGGSMVW